MRGHSIEKNKNIYKGVIPMEENEKIKFGEEYIVIHIDPENMAMEAEFTHEHPYEVLLLYLAFINKLWLKSAIETLEIDPEKEEDFVDGILDIIEEVVKTPFGNDDEVTTEDDN